MIGFGIDIEEIRVQDQAQRDDNLAESLILFGYVVLCTIQSMLSAVPSPARSVNARRHEDFAHRLTPHQ